MSSTPYLAIDPHRVQRNIERMAQWARSQSVQLRPHVKTHKSVRLASWQLDAGACGITVATIGEAEVFVGAGFTDVFIAYPLWIDEDDAKRLNALAERARIIIGVDSVAGAQQALPLLHSAIEWRIEVDSGHHRTGVAAACTHQLARVLVSAGRTVDGAFSFPGHSYSPSARSAAADDEARALQSAAEQLRTLDMWTPTLSGGSSPSMEFARTDVLTEFRPGVYLFGDAQQWELGAHSPEDIALWCDATVISVGSNRYVTNAGSKVLGADRAGFASGYGRVLDDPDARIVLLSEHHSVIESSRIPSLGQTVRIVPNHVCNAVNLVDELHGNDGDRYPVDARGHNG